MSKHPILIAAALSVALLAFLFAGCGGEEPAQTPARTDTARTTGRTPATKTSKAENLIGQVVVATDQTPNDVRRSLESRRPIVVTFYMTGPYDDNQVRSFVSSLSSRYKGQVDFYDYVSTDSRFGDLADLLMVNATPTVVCINRQAKVVKAWTGYVDSDSIEQGIVEATQ